MNSLEFLKELYHDKPSQSFILLWKKKRSIWYKDVGEAAEHIEKSPEDIYFGVGLSPKKFGDYKRCREKDIIGIPGFYADIDIGRKNYPQNADDAMGLLSGNGFNPTLIINSGYGLHAYWLFKEFFEFEDDIQRQSAIEVSKRINYFLKDKAAKKGWQIDNVGDLARILRPVGSLNCKDPDAKKQVSLLKKTNTRYQDLSTFEEFLPELDCFIINGREQITEEEVKAVRAILRLSKIAEPPHDKLDMLLDADITFKQAWQHSKPKDTDRSTSGYHYSLCCVAAKARWSDQDIANLLIAWNRRHSYELDKVLRPDYMALTIANARKDVSAELAEIYSKELDDLKGTPYEAAMAETQKKKATDVISYLMGFKVDEIIKYRQEKDSSYRMITQKGAIFFGSTSELTTHSKFEQRVFAEINVAVNISRKNFANMKGKFEKIIREINVGQENTVESRLAAWITEYLDNEPMRDQHEAAHNDDPFVYDGHWYIFASSFKQWAFRSRHDTDHITITNRDLAIIGAEHIRFNPEHPTKKGKRVTKRAWKIPHSIIVPGDVRHFEDVCEPKEALDGKI